MTKMKKKKKKKTEACRRIRKKNNKLVHRSGRKIMTYMFIVLCIDWFEVADGRRQITVAFYIFVWWHSVFFSHLASFVTIRPRSNKNAHVSFSFFFLFLLLVHCCCVGVSQSKKLIRRAICAAEHIHVSFWISKSAAILLLPPLIISPHVKCIYTVGCIVILLHAVQMCNVHFSRSFRS